MSSGWRLGLHILVGGWALHGTRWADVRVKWACLSIRFGANILHRYSMRRLL